MRFEEISERMGELTRILKNKRKGNPHPKIHPNMWIKYTKKTGAKTDYGKLKSSMNAMKYSGKALRLSKNSLAWKEFEKHLEFEFERFRREYNLSNLMEGKRDKIDNKMKRKILNSWGVTKRN